ncbi:TIGR03668 family PPOX class F420-dependent oxidoreductase [Gandjariella thermophila]|uniref:PPOX class F420-dependent oxidoreductase n=1 Tax=Gandjariella thermophila TaxID=1931992 RepID=A0A4D4J2G3_9PSEU|nr:TIGR03668 family PPOX class F420-dependent oxidoreductase [Gandjariella thermophila]GDY30805.1 PPOX class F420-dependent oxidoreductase [Gandjariella thermophila]
MRLDADEARRRFAASPVARLATADEHGRPHLVPVTFAVRGDVLVTAVDHKPKSGRPLRRVRNAEVNPAVSLLVDAYGEEWDALWWVRLDGRAEVLYDPADMREPVAWLVAKYAQYRDRPPHGPVLRINAECWTGWAAT